MDDILKLEYQLCFRLYAASRNMTRVYQPLLEVYGLTYPQYILMLIMFEHNNIDFKDLSRQIDLKTGTLTPIVNKIEELGYIKKEKNPKDGRRLNVLLTKKGIDLKKELMNIPYQLAEEIGLDEGNYRILMKELDILLNKLQMQQERE